MGRRFSCVLLFLVYGIPVSRGRGPRHSPAFRYYLFHGARPKMRRKVAYFIPYRANEFSPRERNSRLSLEIISRCAITIYCVELTVLRLAYPDPRQFSIAHFYRLANLQPITSSFGCGIRSEIVAELLGVAFLRVECVELECLQVLALNVLGA